MSQTDRLIGRMLGRYRIDALIGRGGLATVYRGTDLEWDVPVAIKVLPEFFASDEEHRQRFHREASTMANLLHPNVMPVRDYGQAEGVTYFVMDYAGGGTLEDRMGRPLPLSSALTLLEPVAAGVAYAHGQGVVHRDLKPSNILYDAEGRPLIADFGIAKLMEESGLTRTRESLGTPEYMAPEQSREASLVGEPADVYALGAILFQLLTGQPPYQGNTAIDIIENHKYAPIPSAHAVVPSLPLEIDEFFRRVLAKEPGARVASVAEMMALLNALAAGQRLPPDPRAPAWEPVAAPAPAASPVTPNTPYYAPQPPAAPARRSTPWGWIALGGVLLIAVVAAGLVWFLTRPDTDGFYQEALRCERAGNWSCCVDELEQVVSLDAGFRDAGKRLLECRRQRDIELAWKELARCREAKDIECVRVNGCRIAAGLDPADVGAGNACADASLTLARERMEDDPEAALQLLTEVKALNLASLPGDFEPTMARLTRYLEGQAAFAAGNWLEAVERLDPVADFRDSRDLLYLAHARQCEALLQAGELDPAQAAADVALKLKNSGAEARSCSEAIRDERYARELDEARTHLAAKAYPAAVAAAERALGYRGADETALDIIVQAYLEQGQAELAAGRYQEAITIAQQALAVRSGDPEVIAVQTQATQALYDNALGRGQVALNACRLPEAVQAFQEALSFKPNDKPATDGIKRAQELQTPITRRIADTYDDWSSQQGKNGWYYLGRTGGTDREIGWDRDAFWWNRGEGSRIARDGQHPGRNLEVVRRWRSTVSGEITLALQYMLQDRRGNTSLYIQVNGRTIWSNNVTSTSLQQPKVGPITVSAGNNVDFIVNANGRQEADFTVLRVTIFQQVAQCVRQ